MRAGILVAMFGLSIGGGCNPYKYNTVDGALGSGGYSTIQQIQDPSMPSGTLVAVGDVVITAIDAFGSATGNLWVEEPSGGTSSGILVYKGVLDGTDLAVGDMVNITNAEKQVYDSDVELGSPATGYLEITVTGQIAVPAPMVVDALSVVQMSGGASNWAPYLGTLVTVDNVAVISDPKCVGSCKDNTYDSFGITGVITVQSELAALPGAGSGSAANAGVGTLDGGDCLASVTGVVDVYDGEYSIYPLATSQIATGGTSCPAPEQANGADGTECTDGIDNDGNGYTDCSDYGCEFSSGAWLDPDNCVATAQMTCGCSTNLVAGGGVGKVNAGMSGPVLLRDVFVTAVGADGYWISDALQASPNGGMYVFTDGKPTVVVGQQVPTLQGVPDAFGDGSASGDLSQLELDNPTAATAVTGGTPLPLADVAVATATSVANGTPYQGSLIQFSNVSVTVAPASANYYQATLTDGTTTFTMSDGAFRDFGTGSAAATTAVGTCYKTLVGVMNLNTYDPQVRMINPRSAADMVVGGTCP